MPTLYLLEPDSQLEKEYERLLVTKDDEVLLRMPVQNVSGVMIVGRAGATTPALHSLLEAGIPLYFVRRNGDLLGSLLPPRAYHLPLRQAQYRLNDQSRFAVELAREIVAAKIHNQAVLAKRIVRRRGRTQPFDGLGVSTSFRRAGELARTCGSMESLLGIEGSAAHSYLEIYRSAFDTAWNFTRRTRRPPKDPINALLSLGYTFLGYAMMTALQVAGLDPYLGYFHAEEHGRPALALDLIEEFRAPVVDSLVMTLINRRLLQPADFERSPLGEAGGIWLTRRGMRVFLREFEDRLETEITLPEIGRPLSYRKLFEVQARKLAHLIMGEVSTYKPFLWR